MYVFMYVLSTTPYTYIQVLILSSPAQKEYLSIIIIGLSTRNLNPILEQNIPTFAPYFTFLPHPSPKPIQSEQKDMGANWRENDGCATVELFALNEAGKSMQLYLEGVFFGTITEFENL